jgi:hypothetical protein
MVENWISRQPSPYITFGVEQVLRIMYNANGPIIALKQIETQKLWRIPHGFPGREARAAVGLKICLRMISSFCIPLPHTVYGSYEVLDANTSPNQERWRRMLCIWGVEISTTRLRV